MVLERRVRVLSALFVLLCAASAVASQVPVTVSPGTATGARIGGSCPTFIWGEVDGAKSYELVVYRLGREKDEPEPVLMQELPGSASGWTPSLDRCLERGGRYAWSVRAKGAEELSDWSPPALFQVAAGPSQAEFEAALATVRQYLALQQPGVVAPPESAPLGAEDPDEEKGAPSAGSSSSALIPGAPDTVSFVTEGAVGVGTSTPLADLHVIGGADNTAGVLIATREGLPGGVAELMFAETPEATYGMKLRYDGGTDKLTLLGQTISGGEQGPWLEIDRDDGAAVFGGAITGDGSGLTSVDADTLDGMDSTAFSTGEHTTDTNAGTLCATEHLLDGDGTCKHYSRYDSNASTVCPPDAYLRGDASCHPPSNFSNVTAVAGDSATGFFPTGQIEEPRIADSIARDSELSAALGKKTVYLTDATHDGANALTACAAGWHMASQWEIPDLLEIAYDSSVAGAFTAYDGATGLPVGSPGWMRTGYLPSGISPGDVGLSNCFAWTSSESNEYGTYSFLSSVEDHAEIHGHTLWLQHKDSCAAALRVWCAKD